MGRGNDKAKMNMNRAQQKQRNGQYQQPPPKFKAPKRRYELLRDPIEYSTSYDAMKEDSEAALLAHQAEVDRRRREAEEYEEKKRIAYENLLRMQEERDAEDNRIAQEFMHGLKAL